MTLHIRYQPASATNPNAARSSEALERMRPELNAIDEKTLSPVNADVKLAVSRALGVAPAVIAMRERIARDCPNADLHAIDQLEDRAYALSFADAQYESAVAPPSELASVVSDVMEARTMLLSVARALISVGLLGENTIEGINGGHGYREAAADALRLVSVLRASLPQTDGKMPLSREHLAEVEGAADRLNALVGIREQTPERAMDAANTQRRAYRLLESAYSEVRRVVTFIRWNEDDADAIAPPLRSRPMVRKPVDKSGDATDTTSPVIAAPAEPAKPAEIVTSAPSTGAPVPPAMKRPNPYGTA